MHCRICNNELIGESIILKELMFGTNETFVYQRCANCNCLQIESIPSEMRRYYPDEYYSFIKSDILGFKNWIKRYLYNILSLWSGDFYKPPSFIKYGLNFTDRKKKILDIGCGDGKLLKEMNYFGFVNLTGIDPFLNNELKTKTLK